MRTAMRDTSLAAFDALLTTPKLQERERQLIAHMARHAHRTFTRSELACSSGIPINVVCGRINRLVAVGIVREGPRRECSMTKNPAHELALAPLQSEMFDA